MFFTSRSGQEAGGEAIVNNLETSTTTTTTEPPTSTAPILIAKTYKPAELAATFGDAVFRVETQGCGYEGIGSAFAISDHHLVTNWHVVATDVTPVLRSRSGATITGRVIGWSEDPDVAVIEVQSDLEVLLEWAETSDLAEGTELASLGYPLPDHDFSVIPGAVLSFVRKGNRPVAIRTDASVDRGSSGGPALTDQGTVAGVVTQIDLNWEGFQFVPLIVTYEALGDTIDNIVKRPTRPNSDCGNSLFTDGASARTRPF